LGGSGETKIASALLGGHGCQQSNDNEQRLCAWGESYRTKKRTCGKSNVVHDLAIKTQVVGTTNKQVESSTGGIKWVR
jgi:hypothetical protein